MTLSSLFAAAAGSVTGRAHRLAERDGQDGFALVARPDVVAAIVTDGCSSGRQSEVGARLGAGWVAALVPACFEGVRDEASARAAADSLTERLVARIDLGARSLHPEDALDPAVLAESFLFGFLAAVVTREIAIVFGVGDGVAVVDGAPTVLDPGPDNAPPYPAYALLGAPVAPAILHVGPTEALAFAAVATDGAAPLVAPTPDRPALAELAADPRLSRNPSLLRKRLVVLADRATFGDDATVATLVRRTP